MILFHSHIQYISGIKTVTVFLCETFGFSYAALMHVLISIYSVEINEITVLFFFFPLVAASVISSFSVRIRMEKERLYELFLITTEISRGLTGGNLKHIKQALKGFWHTSICNMDKR